MTMSEGNELLFVDWAQVERGFMTAMYDPERLSEDGKASMKQRQDEFNIIPDLSGHGMKRVKMPFGVRITPERAQKTAPWLETDRPWESGLGGYSTVLYDEGRYRCWYYVELTKPAVADMFLESHKVEPGPGALGYAESTDGLHWTKPEFDVHKFEGRPTNILTQYGSATSIFRDDSAPAEERYKCFDWDRLTDAPPGPPFTQYGLFPCVSPDGIHWTHLPEACLRYFHDTQNVGTWDPLLKKYVGYFRGHLQGRAIGRSETDDFRHWPPSRVFMYPGPEDAAAEDYYTNCFTTYPGDPSLRLMFPAVYSHNSDDLYVRLAVSRDNYAWNWVSHGPLFGVGAPGEWDCGSLYANPNLVRLPDGRIALPYAGTNETHNESFASFYKDYPPTQFKLAWATWPEGRLAGIEAEDHGEFWCNVTLEGEEIALNARTTRAGTIQVALHEPYGWESKPVPGCGLDECLAFTGDSLHEPMRWKDAPSLAPWQGKNMVLHVRMSNAKLFSLGGSESEAQRAARNIVGLR
jgi:hypothetical protein